MIRKLFPFVIAALLISSCGNKSGKETSSANEKAVQVEFASLIASPADYVDKNIEVKGKVVHVCTKSGKKMFVVGDNPDVMLFVSAGENISKFPMELLGSTITVEGRITRVVTADKPAEEKMVASLETAASVDSTAKATPECETEAALAQQTSLSDLMMIYDKHTLVK